MSIRQYIQIVESTLVEIARPPTRQDADAILRKAGYSRIGAGMFGAVYDKPNLPYVLKVFSSRDQAYMEFIHLARSHRDNPHFPRFLSKAVAVTLDYFAVKMERLTAFNPHQVGDYAYALFDYIQDGRDGRELDAVPELKQACDIVHTKLLSRYWFDHKDESFMMRGNIIVITDAVLDQAAHDSMRFSPDRPFDDQVTDKPSSAKAARSIDSIADDDELLRQLTEANDWSRAEADNAKRYLQSLVDQDQAVRAKYQTFIARLGDWQKAKADFVGQTGADPDDLFGERVRLDAFIAREDRFPFNGFDRKDWHNYWLLAQHCDFDRTFQAKALKTITQHLGQDCDEYRYLTDRISCGLTGTQKFGTQDYCDCDEASTH